MVPACITRENDTPQEPLRECDKDNGSPCQACTDLTKADQRVSQAKATLESALEQRARSKAMVNNRHDPIGSNIPVELACRIFCFCMPEDPSLQYFLNFDQPIPRAQWRESSSTRLRLAAVCQRWRQISFSNPAFWKFLPVMVKPHTPLTRNDLVKEWIGRSGQLALTVCVDSGAASLEPDSGMVANSHLMRALATTIASCMHRISAFYGDSPATFIDYIEGRSATRPAALEALILEAALGRDFHPSTYKHRVKFNVGLPLNPKTVVVTAYRLFKVHIHWGNVTRFLGRFLRPDECIELLHQTPQLIECIFEHAGIWDIDYVLPSSPFTHPSLKVLKLDCCTTGFLTDLSFPALEELICLEPEYTVPDSLRTFVRASGCHLKRLVVDEGIGEELDIIALLETTPTLEELEWYCSADRLVFERLVETTYRDSNSAEDAFLPNLRSFYYCGYRDFPWSMIHEIAPTTPPHTTSIHRPLQQIRLQLTHGEDGNNFENNLLQDMIGLEDLEQILEVIEDGIDLRVEYENINVLDTWQRYYGRLEDASRSPLQVEED